MPYPPEHKAATRARIIESARVMFNRHGFDQVSIDVVMREAGLTRGGFYHHFSSKDELYAEAVRSFMRCNPLSRRSAALGVPPDPQTLARMLVELYLSDEILANVDQQCPLIALPSDVARSGRQPRAAYTQVVRGMLHVFQSAFAPGDEAAEEKARLVINLCVGGMVIARTTEDADLRRSLRTAARTQALAILKTKGPVWRKLPPHEREGGRGGALAAKPSARAKPLQDQQDVSRTRAARRTPGRR